MKHLKDLQQIERLEKLDGDPIHHIASFLKCIIVRKDLFIIAFKSLEDNMIEDKFAQSVWNILVTEFKSTRSHLNEQSFTNLVHTTRWGKEHKMAVVAMYEYCRDYSVEVNEDTFNQSIGQIIFEWKRKCFDWGMQKAMTLRGKNLPDKAIEKLRDMIQYTQNLGTEGRLRTLAEISMEPEEENSLYFPVSFDGITDVVGGGERGKFWVIGGGPNDGKTGYTLELIWPSLLAGYKILWVILEDTERDLKQRVTARMAYELGHMNITSWKIKHQNLLPEDKENYAEVIAALNLENLYIKRPTGLYTASNFEEDVDRMRSVNGLDIAVLDYVGLCADETRREVRHELSYRAWKMSQIASQRNIWTISPWQINREGQKRAEERQTKEGSPYYMRYDLKESSGAEDNARNIVWIHQSEEMKMDGIARYGFGKAKTSKAYPREGWGLKYDAEHCHYYEAI